MKRLGWMIVLVFAAAACRPDITALGAGPSDRSPFNVDCEVGWQGCYRPLDWAPVDVSISAALQKPFEGLLMVAAEQDEVTTVEVTHRFVLTPDVPVWVPLAAKFSFGVSQCKAGIRDAGGRTVWESSYGLWDSRTGKPLLTAVSPDELLVGVSGRMGFGLRHLSQNSHAVSSAGVTVRSRGGAQRSGGPAWLKVYVKDRIQRRLPWDWVAYQCLDLLILYDPEWTALAPQQSEAIAQWVSGGGRLLVVLGSNPLPRDHRLARLLALTWAKRGR